MKKRDIVSEFLEETLPSVEAHLHLARYMSAPKMWESLYHTSAHSLLLLAGADDTTAIVPGKKSLSSLFSEGKVEKDLSSAHADPVESLEGLRAKVGELVTSVQQSFQHFPVGSLSDLDRPEMEDSLGCMMEDLLLDLASISSLLSEVSQQSSTARNSERVCAPVHKHLPRYEEAVQFVADVVGRLGAETY